MERGYLIAALALVATFTAMSHGARSLVEASRACHHYVWSLQPNAGGEAVQAFRAETMNPPVRVDVDVPDAKQLLAKLNIPAIEAQAEMAQQLTRQQEEMAQSLTEEMSRNSEEMSRNAQVMSRNMTEHLVRQNMEIARCARARALQQVERALKNSCQSSSCQ